ncbi:MAG: hypothetical protein V9F00_17940 [Nocardioides sp.]
MSASQKYPIKFKQCLARLKSQTIIVQMPTGIPEKAVSHVQSVIRKCAPHGTKSVPWRALELQLLQ